MSRTKNLNIEEKLIKFIKSLHPIEVAILNERIIKIMEITKQDAEENPDDYSNVFVSHTTFIDLADKAIQQLDTKN